MIPNKHRMQTGLPSRCVPLAKTFAAKVTIALIALLPSASFGQPAKPYDPLASDSQIVVVEDSFSYGNDQREVPLKFYLPADSSKLPVVLFSHGLGGSRDAAQYLGRHWAGRGYAVVMMQHAGSDVNVMDNVPPRQKVAKLQTAMTGVNSQARVRDVSATLDYLQQLTQDDGKYAGRFDLDRVGMSGHSFGAVTTQAVSGQNYGRLGQANTDPRIKAAVAFSPSLPSRAGNAPSRAGSRDAFAKVTVPWLLMTGTEDNVPFSDVLKADQRREVFKGLPEAGHFYELVLDGAEHAAFGDTRGQSKRNPNHHVAIKALSTAFWDCYLKDNQDAKIWLHGSGARSILEEKDVWQRK